MRAVIDHHVDRPGVNVRQRTELTGPNRSIGLISIVQIDTPSQKQSLFTQAQAPARAQRQNQNLIPTDQT
jgi:hypothetical protein